VIIIVDAFSFLLFQHSVSCVYAFVFVLKLLSARPLLCLCRVSFCWQEPRLISVSNSSYHLITIACIKRRNKTVEWTALLPHEISSVAYLAVPNTPIPFRDCTVKYLWMKINFPWFQASAAMLRGFLLFWDITQRRMVIRYRRVGSMYRSHLQGSRSPRRITLEDGTGTLSRNVCKGLPFDAVSHRRRAQISSASRRKSEITDSTPLVGRLLSVTSRDSNDFAVLLGLLDPWTWDRYVVPKRR
jgi:hypothetical protein